MIFDAIGNSARYGALGPRLGRALAWLREGKARGLALGRHELEGSDLFALVQEYDTKPESACGWEAHRRYVDIQVLESGEEYIDWAPLSSCTLKAYDAEKDFQDLETGAGRAMRLEPGLFLVLFPEDAHRPTRAVGAPAGARKIVMKIAVG